MAFGRGQRRSERSKLDATPPWGTRVLAEQPVTTGPWDVRDAPAEESGEPWVDDRFADDDAVVDQPDDETEASGSQGAGTVPNGAPASGAATRGAPRVDFGSLRVPTDTGLQLRFELNEDGAPMAVVLANPNGQMQLGVFAAPRTEGIWDEVRAEIRASISEQGGSAQDREGPFGTELVGRLPQGGSMMPVRFLGVDGPRWFLRGMISGQAAAERNAGEPFVAAFRRLVVVRGDAPLPVREPVPFTVPKDIADRLPPGGAGAATPARPAAATRAERPAGRAGRSGRR